MYQNTDTLIIGGGINGLLTARELRLEGLEVTVIDKSALSQEASWAGGGILFPIYPWRQPEAIGILVESSLRLYPTLSRALFEATGIDPEWRPCGMLISQNPDIDTAINWCMHRQIAYELGNIQRFNRFNTPIENPLWLPEVANIRNPRLLKALQAYLRSLGVRFIEHTEVFHIEIENRRITTLRTSVHHFSANHVILCAGAWSAEQLKRWIPNSSTKLDIYPVRGQMLLFDAIPGTLPHIVLEGDHYLIPRRDGKILAGSTVEDVGFEKMTTVEAKQQLYEFAVRLLPALNSYSVSHHWAGLRPATPLGIPYIGFHPEIDNLFVNAGHFRNGLVMGPASAKLTADLILQRPLTVEPIAYSLNASSRQPSAKS